MRPRRHRLRPAALDLLLALLLGGCDSFPFGSSAEGGFDLTCSVPVAALQDGGVGIDGIPSLENPAFVDVDAPEARFIPPLRRVIGIEVEGEHYAVPHNILWWHEIVNLDLPSGLQLAITYCPLTGSSMVFDREPMGGTTFGVSGLLFQNNLIMYDRAGGRSLSPQMARGARCGPADGTPREMYPALEMTWEAWRQLYPDGQVVGEDTGVATSYRRYPYGDHESLESSNLIYPQANADPRRPMKERVLGVSPRSGEGGIAFPFLELDDASGQMAAIHAEEGGEELVVMWDGARKAAMTYRREIEGEPLTFRAEEDRIVDVETGSTWRVDGVAVDGPLAGSHLEPVTRAYVAFWFAWTDSHPDSELWELPE